MKIVCSVVPVEIVEALYDHLMLFHLCKDYNLRVGELTDEKYYDKKKFKAFFLDEGAWEWPATIEQVRTARSDFEDGWSACIKSTKTKQTSQNIQWMNDYIEACKENKQRARVQ